MEQATALLVEAFREMAPEWLPTRAAAAKELADLFGDDYSLFAALSQENQVMGLIGGQPTYDGHVWELHPLAVHPAHQRKGIGRALVARLERHVHDRGGLTITLGTDDLVGWTSIGGRDLYPDLLGNLTAIQNLGGHPFSFYQRLGFSISGVVPDANGLGKPDILMAKRVCQSPGGSGAR